MRHKTQDRRYEGNEQPRILSPITYLIPLIAILTLVGLFLQRVFAGTIILNPVALHLGPLSIHWYGIILAAAIGGAYEWSRRRLIAQGIDSAVAETIVWWGSVAGILGARLGFVVQNLGFYGSHPIDVFSVMEGGLSIHGAVLGGAFGVWLAARRLKLPFLLLADITAPTVLAGTILGRLGNFMNYELYGYPTTVAWKMFVPLANRVSGYESFAFFHPTFFYEALLNLVMLLIVLWVERAVISNPPAGRMKNPVAIEAKVGISRTARNDSRENSSLITHYPSPPGTIFFLTIALYSISRFIVEFFRIGTEIGVGLTLAQWVSVAVIASSLIVLTRRSTASYNLIKN